MIDKETLARVLRDLDAYAETLRVACIGCGNALHTDADHPTNIDGDTLCLLCTCQRYMPPSKPTQADVDSMLDYGDTDEF